MRFIDDDDEEIVAALGLLWGFILRRILITARQHTLNSKSSGDLSLMLRNVEGSLLESNIIERLTGNHDLSP